MKNILILLIVLIVFACSKDADQQLNPADEMDNITITIDGQTEIYNATIGDPINTTRPITVIGATDPNNTIVFIFSGASAGDYSGDKNVFGALIDDTHGWFFDSDTDPTLKNYDTFIITEYGQIGGEIRGYFSKNHNGVQIDGSFKVSI